ncbi:MAG TPA: GrpB family protein [Ktedonobacterales bacterium]|nr:GrpB family protein [Ktedonobacterales bacterium]
MSDETDKPKPLADALSIEERMRGVLIGPLQPLTGKIVIAPYSEEWPRMFAAQADRIRAALGERALLLEHAGSTSVPGLAAKPIIDIVLVVADPANEADYVPALEAAGYTLRAREPDWYQHRNLKYTNPDVNLHVFGPDCEEVARMLMMRDWLRRNEADRALYERTKRELAQRDWKYTQEYADAKTNVVQEVLGRARAALGGA